MSNLRILSYLYTDWTEYKCKVVQRDAPLPVGAGKGVLYFHGK